MAECSHTRKTKTAVGGFTCDECGLYLFERRGELGPDNSPQSIVGGMLCEFDYQLGKWMPVEEKQQ